MYEFDMKELNNMKSVGEAAEIIFNSITQEAVYQEGLRYFPVPHKLPAGENLSDVPLIGIAEEFIDDVVARSKVTFATGVKAPWCRRKNGTVMVRVGQAISTFSGTTEVIEILTAFNLGLRPKLGGEFSKDVLNFLEGYTDSTPSVSHIDT